MKRIFILSIALFYLVASSGVTIGKFYCCGKLKETFIVFQNISQENCKGKKSNSGCCKTETFFSKVNDTHSPSVQERTEVDCSINFLIPLLSVFVFHNTVIQISDYALVHPPPLLSKQPVYLSVCSFLI